MFRQISLMQFHIFCRISESNDYCYCSKEEERNQLRSRGGGVGGAGAAPTDRQSVRPKTRWGKHRLTVVAAARPRPASCPRISLQTSRPWRWSVTPVSRVRRRRRATQWWRRSWWYCQSCWCRPACSASLSFSGGSLVAGGRRSAGFQVRSINVK